MMEFSPRLVTAVLCAAALSLSANPAFAQGAEQKPAEQQQQQQQPGPTGEGKNTQKIDELAEAARALIGPAGNAECVWLGRRVVSLLWRDDLDTAFRHLDLYDRFGCPANHIQATFRCVVRHGPFDVKVPESLNGRVHACWLKPEPANADEGPAATTARSPAAR
jgi:hypothetical protein